LEVVDAIVSRIGAARTGIRFSPFSIGQEMRMADPIPQYSHLLSELAKQHPDLAYVHFIEPRVVRFARDRDYEIIETSDSLDFARNIWRPTGSAFLSAGGFVPETALRHYDIPGRENEAVVFGRWFISNVCTHIHTFDTELTFPNSLTCREEFKRIFLSHHTTVRHFT
jgi:NADPH2 dehydrogenase